VQVEGKYAVGTKRLWDHGPQLANQRVHDIGAGREAGHVIARRDPDRRLGVPGKEVSRKKVTPLRTTCPSRISRPVASP
jgi:hypothetical protein